MIKVDRAVFSWRKWTQKGRDVQKRFICIPIIMIIIMHPIPSPQILGKCFELE